MSQGNKWIRCHPTQLRREARKHIPVKRLNIPWHMLHILAQWAIPCKPLPVRFHLPTVDQILFLNQFLEFAALSHGKKRANIPPEPLALP